MCEGPTEAGYFEGLCDLFDIRDSYTIEILPQQTDDDKEVKYKGSSIKGLLYMAMKKQKMATIPFDEVWIVPDNDEENAFKLEENSFQRIKESVPEHLYENLKAHQLKEMDVREVEQQNNEHCRVRYFLSLVDYENFLKEHIPNPADLQFVETIISLTTKKRDFLYLYSDSAKIFFYDKEGAFISKNYRGRDAFEERFFDKNWQKYIKTAYSCISFEHWILLHFEKNNHSFYNSREIIKYFDDNNYFGRQFEKGWYLYENRDSGLVKAFFNCGHRAIKNNIWLNTTIQPRIHEGRKFYEVNPYSDVFCLASLLLKHQNITLIHTETIVSYRKFKDLRIIRKNEIIFISFFFNGSQSILKRNLEQLFSVFDENDNKIDLGIPLSSDSVIRKEDSVKIEITLKLMPNSPLFLYLIENDAVLVCMI